METVNLMNAKHLIFAKTPAKFCLFTLKSFVFVILGCRNRKLEAYECVCMRVILKSTSLSVCVCMSVRLVNVFGFLL